ncbi:nitrate reductase molybdenum cofactor assembly chaperone, partial [Brachybacterium paraconglomeratum]|nr:nitrate reductase molybdenum cofactor assembly chaperone [Brachybacterium paraconglomeratum]
MGALARLLGRRSADGAPAADGGGTGAATLAPKRVRSPKDLLHASGLTTPQLRATWLAVSWLLTYPDEATLSRGG